VRAVVLNAAGEPEPAEVAEPAGEDVVRVLASGLCGSDVEKIGHAPAGTVLGHEVVGETGDGRRVVLVHHLPCGECERCLAGHESTCEEFGAATIEPGGFAERVSARGGWVQLPDGVDDVTGSYAEPLACVLRGAERVPRGDVLVLGGGFVGRLFEAALRHRGDTVYVRDRDPARSGPEPPGLVGAAVVCAPSAAADALAAVEPGGSVLFFADAGPLDAEEVYRRELTIAGSRSATPRHLAEAVALLPDLDLPEALVLPLERFAEGLAAYRNREALKVVFRP
jgi:L-iditol 2-dehydrogenase